MKGKGREGVEGRPRGVGGLQGAVMACPLCLPVCSETALATYAVLHLFMVS
jgi:hypothetical protein